MARMLYLCIAVGIFCLWQTELVNGLRNIAVPKPSKSAGQSSVYTGGGHGTCTPDKAVDGSTANYAGGDCSITDQNNGAFWWVDLGYGSLVSKIILYGRRNPTYQNQLSKFNLYVTNKLPEVGKDVYGPNSPDLCATRTANVVVSAEFECLMVGRYVVVQNVVVQNTNTSGARVLTICEVEVFGAENAVAAFQVSNA